jgi:hypothetical protein
MATLRCLMLRRKSDSVCSKLNTRCAGRARVPMACPYGRNRPAASHLLRADNVAGGNVLGDANGQALAYVYSRDKKSKRDESPSTSHGYRNHENHFRAPLRR